MSNIEETLEHHGFKKHLVFTKPDPRGPEYGLMTIEPVMVGEDLQVFVSPVSPVRPCEQYTMVFPGFTDFLHWLKHQL